MGNRECLHTAFGSRRGAAMTETALLCFFIYVPVLMMVIVWGDMTLDKERAHIAASYMAFRKEPMEENTVQSAFFPGADGGQDGTGSVRQVNMNPGEDDTTELGPEFELPSSRSGDYSGEAPEFDLQYKLFSMAMGEVHVTQEMQAQPDGSMGFVSQVERIQNDVSRYLTENDIVSTGFSDDSDEWQDMGGVTTGDTFQLDTGVSSRDYSEYVAILTDVLNGEWGAMAYRMPRYESTASLGTTFQSPFLSELEREESAPDRDRESEQYVGGGPFDRIGGRPGFRMQFGPAGQLESDDDSFYTGYTYIRNSDVRPDADEPWEYVGALSEQLFEYPETGARLVEMGEETPLSTERRETDDQNEMIYLEAGDPRLEAPSEEE